MSMLVNNFDRLSDKLCGVIDMCEAIWTSHPDQRWKEEAGRVYEELCRVMNEMNVDQELYEVGRKRFARRGLAGNGDSCMERRGFGAVSEPKSCLGV